MIRFNRKQVIHNLSVGFAALVRSYRLSLQAMGFKGSEGEDILSESLLEAMRAEKLIVRLRVGDESGEQKAEEKK